MGAAADSSARARAGSREEAVNSSSEAPWAPLQELGGGRDASAGGRLIGSAVQEGALSCPGGGGGGDRGRQVFRAPPSPPAPAQGNVVGCPLDERHPAPSGSRWAGRRWSCKPPGGTTVSPGLAWAPAVGVAAVPIQRDICDDSFIALRGGAAPRLGVSLTVLGRRTGGS